MVLAQLWTPMQRLCFSTFTGLSIQYLMYREGNISSQSSLFKGVLQFYIVSHVGYLVMLLSPRKHANYSVFIASFGLLSYLHIKRMIDGKIHKGKRLIRLRWMENRYSNSMHAPCLKDHISRLQLQGWGAK